MPTKSELLDQVSQLERATAKANAYHPKKHKDETRAKIALFVVKAYFVLIGATLFLGPVYNQVANPNVRMSVIDVITMLSGVIGTPFGFVVGYYFKGSENE